MGTKNNPGTFDCYANAHPDEPMFVLLGRDLDAPLCVELWATIRARNGEDPAKVEEARACASAMREYGERRAATSVAWCEAESDRSGGDEGQGSRGNPDDSMTWRVDLGRDDLFEICMALDAQVTRLCGLALSALGPPEAQPVLHDMLEEQAWRCALLHARLSGIRSAN